MLNREIVDVIIPIFNQYEFAKQCINSVIVTASQNLFEIIVIDDASTEPILVEFLRTQARRRLITLHTNEKNLGFTRTVNYGMRLHPARDVLLLNSDTMVFGDWLERLKRGAYSEKNIATANPLTSGSHISNYPFRQDNERITLEVTYDVLDILAADVNAGRIATVHTTVGFCMFIKRRCLDYIGLFDAQNFPTGYGEEADFCYRARKVGWKHIVVGDVFVPHFDGQSFGERKQTLMAEMLKTFDKLHPEYHVLDERFDELDPVASLRVNLDLGRVKRRYAPLCSLDLEVIENVVQQEPHTSTLCLRYNPEDATIKIAAGDNDTFPNLERYLLPRDLLRLNAAMAQLGVESITCRSAGDKALLERQLKALPMEMTLVPRLRVRDMAEL